MNTKLLAAAIAATLALSAAEKEERESSAEKTSALGYTWSDRRLALAGYTWSNHRLMSGFTWSNRDQTRGIA